MFYLYYYSPVQVKEKCTTSDESVPWSTGNFTASNIFVTARSTVVPATRTAADNTDFPADPNHSSESYPTTASGLHPTGI